MRQFLSCLGLLFVLGCGTAINDAKKNVVPKGNVTAAPAVTIPVANPASVMPTPAQTSAPAETGNANPAPVTLTTEPSSSSGEIMVVPFSELAEAYHEDKKLMKFGDKTIEVTVIVSRINSEQPSFLKEDEVPRIAVGNRLRPTEFWINEQTRQPWAWITSGQQVTLRSRKAVEPNQNVEWDIVKFGANPAPILAATTLAEEFLNNPVVAAQKYNDRPVYVSGEVLETEEGSNQRIVLKGTKALNVVLYCKTVPSAKSIKAGQTINGHGVIGVLRTLSSFPNEVDLVDAMPITIPFPVQGVKYPESMADSNRDRAQQMRDATPDFKFSMDEFNREKEENRKSARYKFDGKLFELSGVITSFLSRKNADVVVLDRGKDKDSIWCELAEFEPWKSYSPGQRVTVRGRYETILGHLEEAVVVSAEPLPSFTAGELVDLHLKDPIEFHEKWKGRTFEVVGKLKSVEPSGFELVGTDDVAVNCRFSNPFNDEKSPNRARFDTHAVGDELRIIAKIDPNFSKPEFLELFDAWDRTRRTERGSTAELK
jgi:hypothetical protein